MAELKNYRLEDAAPPYRILRRWDVDLKMAPNLNARSRPVSWWRRLLGSLWPRTGCLPDEGRSLYTIIIGVRLFFSFLLSATGEWIGKNEERLWKKPNQVESLLSLWNSSVSLGVLPAPSRRWGRPTAADAAAAVIAGTAPEHCVLFWV